MAGPVGFWVSAYGRIKTVLGFHTAREVLYLTAPLVATDNTTEERTDVTIADATTAAAGLLSADNFDKLEALAPGAYLPRTTPVVEPSALALANGITVLSFASTTGSSFIAAASLVAGEALVAADINYAQVDLHDRNLAAGTNGASLWTGTTETTAHPEGSGDWVAGKIAYTATLNYALPAGHALIAVWSSGGIGAATPGGNWRIT